MKRIRESTTTVYSIDLILNGKPLVLNLTSSGTVFTCWTSAAPADHQFFARFFYVREKNFWETPAPEEASRIYDIYNKLLPQNPLTLAMAIVVHQLNARLDKDLNLPQVTEEARDVTDLYHMSDAYLQLRRAKDTQADMYQEVLKEARRANK